jgi:hypothetical protein
MRISRKISPGCRAEVNSSTKNSSALITRSPFALTATSSDANGDTLTYSWEQGDLGPATLLSTADNGNSPLFRVYNPTSSPTRTFPKLSSILSGVNGTAAPSGGGLVERLPTVARAMDFRVKVRDNRAGGGGVNIDDMVVNVVNTGTAFLLTSQNSVATLPGGSTQTVTWNVAGTTANGINAASVNIRLSTDGGNTFPTLLATNVANDGSEAVVIPATPTTQARIKVEPTNNVFFDINNADLTITAVPVSATPGTPDLTATSDTGASPTDNRTNLDNGTAASSLRFNVTSTVSGATVTVYADGTAIGSAVASSTTTAVVTDGTLDLVDGNHLLTARQTEPGKSQSAASSALTVRIDTLAPTLDFTPVSPNPRTTPLASAEVIADDLVTGFDVADLTLTRDGVTVPLTPAQALTGAEVSTTITVPNLASLTTRSGTYVLTINAAGSGVLDRAGNALVAGDSVTWVNNDPAPAVADVFVAGTAWTSAYRNALATSGDGEAAFGYRIKANEQTRTLGWANLNQISIRFSEAVNVAADDLVINGVNLAVYGLASSGAFTYDPATKTATWTLNRFIPNDKLTLNLDGDDPGGVTDAAGNPLDGEWLNPVSPAYSADSYPSGNGTPGGDFLFDLRVLPGDVTRDGAVNAFDYNIVRLNLNQTGKGVAGGDLNGDDLVDVVDFNDCRAYLNKTAPA